VWSASAGGSWGVTDSLLVGQAENYGHDYGAEVVPYVPAAYNLLRPTLDTLPKPTINSEEQDEKVAADE